MPERKPPFFIPINPEHLIVYDARLDNVKVEGEKPCCKYAKQITYLQLPCLGIVRMNVNYCFVCGQRLHRHSSEGWNPGGTGSPDQVGG